MDVIVGGEVDMVVNVNVPNNTRAGSEKGIFESGILESSDTTMRYTLQVFYTDENKKTHKTEPQRNMAEDIVRSFGFKAESYRQAKAKDEPQTERSE